MYQCLSNPEANPEELFGWEDNTIIVARIQWHHVPTGKEGINTYTKRQLRVQWYHRRYNVPINQYSLPDPAFAALWLANWWSVGDWRYTVVA